MSLPRPMTSRARRVLPAAALTLIAGLCAATSAHAREPQAALTCGQTITHSVKLTGDLTNCPANGLVIGADNITVDLDGHTIDGTVTPATDCNVRPSGVAGIDNTGGFDGLTFTGGTVQQFANGISAGSETTAMSDSRLRDLTVRDNRFGGINMGSRYDVNRGNVVERNTAYGNGCGQGITLNSTHGSRVAHNIVYANGGGILVCCSDHNVVERNAVRDNRTYGIGVFFGADSHNVIRRNAISGNGDEGIVVALSEGDQNNVIEDNDISHNAFPGIVLDHADANRVSANHLTHNGDGIIVFGDRNTVTANQVADVDGCPDGCGYGVSVEGGTGNLVARNEVMRTVADGIRVAAFEAEVPTTDTTVRDNQVRSAGVDGFSVAAEGDGSVSGTLLESNRASRAHDDGFDVRSASTTLTGNLALRNAALGIKAVLGVIDGGGNEAHANGDPRQCTNVYCG